VGDVVKDTPGRPQDSLPIERNNRLRSCPQS
jgi:hypothetical protein